MGYGSTVIPNRGAWELESDSKDIAILVSTVLVRFHLRPWFRTLGFSGDDEIFDIFGDSELVRNTVEKKISTRINGSQTKP